MHPHGCFVLRIGRGQSDAFHLPQLLHIHAKRLRSRAVRLAAPCGGGIVVDRHQRAVIERGIGSARARREFAGLDHAFEHTAVAGRFRDLHPDLVAAGCGEADADLVRRGGEIAVAVLDLRVDEVAGLHLIAGACRGAWQRLLFLLLDLLFECVGERIIFLIHDLAARDLKRPVGGDAQAGVAEKLELELLLEILRVIHGDDVSAGDLEDAVAGFRHAECRGDFGKENAFARAAAGEEGLLHIVARLGADFDRDARVTTADSEIRILHHDGQGVAGRLPLLRFLAEAADRAQRFQLC